MPPRDVTWRVPSKLAVTVIGVLLSGAISFNVWAVAAVFDRPTKSEVSEMIEDKSPYGRDRAMILSVLETIKDDIDELKTLVRNAGTVSKP